MLLNFSQPLNSTELEQVLLVITNKSQINAQLLLESAQKFNLKALALNESELTIDNQGNLLTPQGYNIKDFGFIFLGIWSHQEKTDNPIDYKSNYISISKKYINLNPLLFFLIQKDPEIRKKAIIYGQIFYYKTDQLIYFAKNKISHVESYITKDVDYLKKIINEGALTFPVVIKPYTGSGGYKVEKILDQETLFAKVKESDKQLIIQKYIPNNKEDYRVFIIRKGQTREIIGIMKRIGQNSQDFRNNICLGAIGVKADLPNEIKQECLKIVEIMDLDVAGIDVIQDADKGSYHILEVNSSPIYKGLIEATGINPVEEIVKYIKEYIENNKTVKKTLKTKDQTS